MSGSLLPKRNGYGCATRNMSRLFEDCSGPVKRRPEGGLPLVQFEYHTPSRCGCVETRQTLAAYARTKCGSRLFRQGKSLGRNDYIFPVLPADRI